MKFADGIIALYRKREVVCDVDKSDFDFDAVDVRVLGGRAFGYQRAEMLQGRSPDRGVSGLAVRVRGCCGSAVGRGWRG